MKTIFLSYSWDSEEHKDWVMMLAEQLQRVPGLGIRLDRWHLSAGDSLTKYMEEIASVDYCVAVCTPKYAMKSNQRSAGAGYEAQIITAEILAGASKTKFLPIVREGDFDIAFPTFFRGKYSIDFREDPNFLNSLDELLRVLFEKPRYTPPDKSELPDFLPQQHSDRIWPGPEKSLEKLNRDRFGPFIPRTPSNTHGGSGLGGVPKTAPILFPHHIGLYVATFSPSGQNFVSGTKDGLVTVWSIAEGNISKALIVGRHQNDSGGVVFASYSKDESRILSASEDSSACLWYSTITATPLNKFYHDGVVNTAVFSKIENNVLTASWDGTVRLWNAEKSWDHRESVELFRVHPSVPNNQNDIDPDDDRVMNSAYYSPDGKKIIVACTDGNAYILEAETGKYFGHLPVQNREGLCSAAYSPCGKLIVTTGDGGTAWIWDADKLTLINTLKGKFGPRHEAAIWSADFSPDSKMVTTSSSDKWAYVWDVASGRILWRLQHPMAVITSVFAPCGSKILTACDDSNARLWGLQ